MNVDLTYIKFVYDLPHIWFHAVLDYMKFDQCFGLHFIFQPRCHSKSANIAVSEQRQSG